MGLSIAPGSRMLNAEQIKTLNEADQKRFNALGYEVNITTMTQIIQEVSEQKFYKIPFAKYLPVKSGFGAWASNLQTFRSYHKAAAFAEGVVNTGGDNTRLARATAGVDSLNTLIHYWAMETGWSIIDVQMASKSGNWDLISEQEMSRKEAWDVGLQKLAFLGLDGDTTNFPGLFNLPGVTINTTTLSKSITALAQDNTTTLSAAIAKFLADYQANCSYTQMPNRFVVPQSDFLGFMTATNSTYTIKTIMDYMLDTFKTLTGNPDFQILPCAYGDKTVSGASVQYYALYHSDPRTLRMNIPVEYATTLPNSQNNFNFSCVGYGGFTGVQVIRPAEILYYQF